MERTPADVVPAAERTPVEVVPAERTPVAERVVPAERTPVDVVPVARTPVSERVPPMVTLPLLDPVAVRTAEPLPVPAAVTLPADPEVLRVAAAVAEVLLTGVRLTLEPDAELLCTVDPLLVTLPFPVAVAAPSLLTTEDPPRVTAEVADLLTWLLPAPMPSALAWMFLSPLGSCERAYALPPLPQPGASQ